jgi:hypothetical protein
MKIKTMNNFFLKWQWTTTYRVKINWTNMKWIIAIAHHENPNEP